MHGKTLQPADLFIYFNLDKNVKRFMSDDFLYYFIVRFVLCGVFLRYHSSFKDEKVKHLQVMYCAIYRPDSNI